MGAAVYYGFDPLHGALPAAIVAALSKQTPDRLRVIAEAYSTHAGKIAGGDAVQFLVAHFLVGGAKVHGHGAPRGERALHMGEAYAATSEAIPPGPQYVALGHIHAPQPVPGAKVPAEYAGSLLELDFGEAGEGKRVVIVDAEPPFGGPGHQAWMMNEINALIWPSADGIGALPVDTWDTTVQIMLDAGIIENDPGEGVYRTDLADAALLEALGLAEKGLSDIEIVALGTRRGPAPEAQACYTESEGSVTARNNQRTLRRVIR